MSDTQKLIGTTLDEDNNIKRDAIHIAVLPVMAIKNIYAGAFIKLIDPDRMLVMQCDRREAHGIVDPFIADNISAGERFFMFLFPNTVTDMRHQWKHPSIPDEPGKITVASNDAKEIARNWLTSFAQSWNMDLDRMIEGADRGDGITAMGSDIHSWEEISETDAAFFWMHLETLMDKQYSQAHREGTYFGCSC